MAWHQAEQFDIELAQTANSEKVIVRLLKGASVSNDARLKGISIKAGEYAQAVQMTKGYDTFNAALAQLLNGDAQAALKTIKASGCDCAATNYLAAVAYARLGQNAQAKAALAKVAQQDAAMAAKAETDLEFRNL